MNRYKYLIENPDKKIKVESAEEFLKLMIDVEDFEIPIENPDKSFHLFLINTYFKDVNDDDFVNLIENYLLEFIPDKRCNLKEFNSLYIIYCTSMRYVFSKCYKIAYDSFQKEKAKTSKYKMLSHISESKKRKFIIEKIDDMIVFLNELIFQDVERTIKVETSKVKMDGEKKVIIPFLIEDLFFLKEYYKKAPLNSRTKNLITKEELKRDIEIWGKIGNLKIKNDALRNYLENIDTIVKNMDIYDIIAVQGVVENLESLLFILN